MKFKGIASIHGMRAVFRTWASEATHFPNDLIEMALAHTVGSKVERAYRRTDMLDKRRELTEAWASYIERPATPAEVVPLARRRA
jgi:integrase